MEALFTLSPHTGLSDAVTILRTAGWIVDHASPEAQATVNAAAHTDEMRGAVHALHIAAKHVPHNAFNEFISAATEAVEEAISATRKALQEGTGVTGAEVLKKMFEKSIGILVVEPSGSAKLRGSSMYQEVWVPYRLGDIAVHTLKIENRDGGTAKFWDAAGNPVNVFTRYIASDGGGLEQWVREHHCYHTIDAPRFVGSELFMEGVGMWHIEKKVISATETRRILHYKGESKFCRVGGSV
jgi:hypothetical protein